MMQDVDKREQEMALQENYYKLQHVHDYLKGEHKRLTREGENLAKKYEKQRAQAAKDVEIASARLSALEMKARQIPELEKQLCMLLAMKERIAELETQVENLGNRASELAIMESEAGPRAVRQYRESEEHREELKNERESFMHRKIKEWSEAGWLDLQTMMVEVERKAEEEKAKVAASTSQNVDLGSEGEDPLSEGEKDSHSEEEEEIEEVAGKSEPEGAAAVEEGDADEIGDEEAQVDEEVAGTEEGQAESGAGDDLEDLD